MLGQPMDSGALNVPSWVQINSVFLDRELMEFIIHVNRRRMGEAFKLCAVPIKFWWLIEEKLRFVL